MRELNDVLDSLKHHKPPEGDEGEDMALQMEELRSQAADMALAIAVVRDGRCRAIANTKLEECLMWAIKGVVLPLLVAMCLVGCSLDGEVWQSVDQAWRLVEPDYKRYVEEDARLDERAKLVRIQHAEALTGLLQEVAARRGFIRRPLEALPRR